MTNAERYLTEALDLGAPALGRINAIGLLRAELDVMARANVAAARERGASWDAIGHALGVSRQAAQQRYGDRTN